MRCGLQRANSIRRRVYKKQAQKKARNKAGYSILAMLEVRIGEGVQLCKLPQRINQRFIADKLGEQQPVIRIQVAECRV
jgi:hypothetical protein